MRGMYLLLLSKVSDLTPAETIKKKPYQKNNVQDMEWQLSSFSSRLSKEEVAQKILQIYMESLQDHNELKNILSEYSILDYFGKSFYGQEEVCSHLTANLYGSSFELSSLTTDDKELPTDWDSVCEIKAFKVERELGVSLISTPTSSFPGLAFFAPMRMISRDYKHFDLLGKRGPLDPSFDQLCEMKKCKFDSDLNGNRYGGGIAPSKAFNYQIPKDMRFLSSFGTISYSKRLLASSDPKKIKHHSIGSRRDRFCHLYIGFQCDEHFVSVANCKIWIIKYEISSKVTPRNLLKSFNETDYF